MQARSRAGVSDSALCCISVPYSAFEGLSLFVSTLRVGHSVMYPNITLSFFSVHTDRARASSSWVPSTVEMMCVTWHD